MLNRTIPCHILQDSIYYSLFLPVGKDVCLSNEMKCDGDKCINKLWKCDGEINCADGSDEVDCGKCEVDVDLSYTGVKESTFMRHAATLIA